MLLNEKGRNIDSLFCFLSQIAEYHRLDQLQRQTGIFVFQWIKPRIEDPQFGMKFLLL